MSRRVAGLLVLVSVFGVIALAGCGGGGGEKGTVAGYVYAPNGTDPAPGVLVFIVTKAEPPELSDYTDPDGYFEIGDVPAGAQDLQVGEGALAVTVEIDVVAGETNVVAPQDDPIKIGEGVEVKMAVATGSFDTIEEVLTRLGFATLTTPDDAGTGYVLYSDISTVLSSQALLDKYQVIFLNCGTEEGAIYDGPQMERLRTWVAGGASLYASDWAYDFLEVGWPNAIEFYGDDAVPGAAHVGDAGTANAEVLDPGLQAALGKNTATIEFNLGIWAVAESAGSGTDVLMTADEVFVSGLASAGLSDRRARAAGRQTSITDNPILLRFHPAQGTVIYTAFHNEAQVSADMDAILETLAFGM